MAQDAELTITEADAQSLAEKLLAFGQQLTPNEQQLLRIILETPQWALDQDVHGYALNAYRPQAQPFANTSSNALVGLLMPAVLYCRKAGAQG